MDEELIIVESRVKVVNLPRQLLVQMTKWSEASLPLEAIGLVAGYENREKELLVTKVELVTTGDEVSVNFSDEHFNSFNKMINQIEDNKSHIIGWWHSHPGYGLFLSMTDIITHVYSFQVHNPLAIAIVIDPSKKHDDINAVFNVYQVRGTSAGPNFQYQEIASYLI